MEGKGFKFNGPDELTAAELHSRDSNYEQGWRWIISSPHWELTFLVLVVSGRGDDGRLPRESRDAINSKGRTAIEAALEKLDPPRRIAVTSAGLKFLE